MLTTNLKKKYFKLLNLGPTIKANIIWVFLSSYLIEKKESITLMTSFLMFFWKSSQLNS
jgi:hypothetical protein